MEIQVLEKTDTRLKFNLHGAGHTFCHNLKRELNRSSEVDVAAYTIEHPLIGIPTFIVLTKKKANFSSLLSSAAKNITKENDATRKLVSKL